MKLLHLALPALALLLSPTWAKAAVVSHHIPAHAPAVSLALEPASFLLVGLGLAGGGVLRRKQIRAGLSVLSAEGGLPELATDANLPRAVEVKTARNANLASARSVPFRHAARIFAAVVGTVALLGASHGALADTISISTGSVPTITLAPSWDAISMNSGTTSVNPTSGPFTLQTGMFYLGSSSIPDQNIPFTFQDTITLNGITQTVTFAAQDNVTAAADELTIFGGIPIVFGGETLTVQTFDLTAYDIGKYSPINLEATVTPTPEPGSLILLGTGLFCITILCARKRHSAQELHAANVVEARFRE